MLQKIRLRNFKPFDDFTVEFGTFNVVTGLNNMGKSSVIDGLRLISLELNYRLRRDFIRLPTELFGPRAKGYLVDPQGIPFPIANVHHGFNELPSYIDAQFDRDLRVRIAFDGGRNPDCYLAVFDGDDVIDTVDSIRNALEGRHMAVLPQVSPLEEKEGLLTKKYVLSEFGTRLTDAGQNGLTPSEREIA